MAKRTLTPPPEPVDMHVGDQIRLRRQLLKISQEKLAGALGLTFQQIQKYESGRNRVSASRLYGIAKFLRVEVGHFFEGLPSTTNETTASSDPMTDPTAVRLIVKFNKLSYAQQEMIASLCDVMREHA